MGDKQNQKLIAEKKLDEETRYTTAASKRSMKAQLLLAQQYTPASELKRLGSRRWNSSNSDLRALSMDMERRLSCPNLAEIGSNFADTRMARQSRTGSLPDLRPILED